MQVCCHMINTITKIFKHTWMGLSQMKLNTKNEKNAWNTVDYYLHTKFYENWTNCLGSSLTYISPLTHTYTYR
jgi:hypothetical protein